MVIVIANMFDVLDRSRCKSSGTKELLASHGYDTETGFEVVLQQVHPSKLGATFSLELGEWVL